MTNVIINGSKGRMGKMLVQCAARFNDLRVTGETGKDVPLASAIGNADVVIDFSVPEVTLAVAQTCAANKKALVIGTTGHSEEQKKKIIEAAKTIPVVWASNFSTGVNTLFWLTRKATQILGGDFDLEVVEMHHRLKKDAPSGTAETLASILATERKLHLEEAARHGRSGLVGARTSSEIGIHSIRGGDVVGDHTVIFATQGERVELTHKASSRETFANGALKASMWLVGRTPGIYNMEDVLGLK